MCMMCSHYTFLLVKLFKPNNCSLTDIYAVWFVHLANSYNTTGNDFTEQVAKLDLQ